MHNKTGWGIIILLLILYVGLVNAVSITELSITDVLNNDLSMTENILLSIENNTENSFTMNIPAGAYNILVDGNDSVHNITTPFACEKCTVSVNYSFLGLVKNDSGIFTFFRKIDLPVNITKLVYKIELPVNYTLFDIKNLSVSIIPEGVKILGNTSFEWMIDKPKFPSEFGIRYIEAPIIEDKHLPYGYAIVVMVILLLLFIALLARRIINRRKAIKKI